MKFAAFWLVGTVFGLVVPCSAQTTVGKKLIQYGWDAPDSAYLRKHAKRMAAASPFDGVVVTIRSERGEGKLGGTDALSWSAFRDEGRFKPQQFEHAIEDLKAAKAESTRFTDNFIALISHPNDAKGLDWSSSDSPLARAATEGLISLVPHLFSHH